jgi:hypothetical protein
VQTEPSTTATPTPTRGAATDHTRVEVLWTALTTPADTGGSPITSYNLQWDSGAGGTTFTDLVGQAASPYLETSYLLTAGVTSGTTYQFRLQAWNKWGAGGYGTVASIRASTVPAQVDAPTVAVSGAMVQISWALPAEQGAAVTAYTVKIRASDGNYYESALCDGSLASVVAARSCEIAMSALRTAPFNLAFNELILATVSATNADGTGLESLANSGGAAVQTEPV